jgi:hypothetical protein
MLRRLILAVFSLGLLCVGASAQAPAARSFLYTAQLSRDTLESGRVDASGIVWQCSGRACTVSGPWVAPGVPACAALASRVGTIASYGRPGVQLSAAQLAQCNANARSNVVLAQPPQLRPPRALQQQAGVAIRTPTLTLTGTGALPERGSHTPVAIRANTLTLTGTGSLPERGSHTPTAIRTQTLTLTGATPPN